MIERRGQVLRHPRLVPLARGAHLQDARARAACRATAATASARRATAAGSSPTRSLSASTAARSPTCNRMSVADAPAFFAGLRLDADARRRSRASILERDPRTGSRYLLDVGLGYLTLDRQSRTLSGGELERVDLTTRRRLVAGEHALRPRRAVDRPAPARQRAPGAHPAGPARAGGTPSSWSSTTRRSSARPTTSSTSARAPASAAARSSSPARSRSCSSPTRARSTGAVPRRPPPHPGAEQAPAPDPRPRARSMRGARAHNLRGVDVAHPARRAWSASPASRARASPRWSRTSSTAACAAPRPVRRRARRARRDRGRRNASPSVVLVDQSAARPTPRANPHLPQGVRRDPRRSSPRPSRAQLRGFTAATFSFNVAGGRCETCGGEGFEKVEMQFLSDVYVTCPDVRRRALPRRRARGALPRHSRSATCSTSPSPRRVRFFGEQPDVARACSRCSTSASATCASASRSRTLSGGEAQRLKLAAALGRETKAHTLFLFDEPTTGLHFADVETLLAALQRLVERGHSVLVIEHNLEVAKAADWVIDLGPDGGAGGGARGRRGHAGGGRRRRRGSHTGRYLARGARRAATAAQLVAGGARRRRPAPRPTARGADARRRRPRAQPARSAASTCRATSSSSSPA